MSNEKLDSLRKKYANAHNDITNKYYRYQQLTKEQFEVLHELLWHLFEKEKYDKGIYSDEEIDDNILSSATFQNMIQERITFITSKINELTERKNQICGDFKYTFE